MIMPRYRSRQSLRPIHRIKHVVDSSATLAGGTNVVNVLVSTKDAPVLANTTEVETGSTVNGIYLRLEVASNEAIDLGAIPNVYMAVYKIPGGNLTAINPQAEGVIDDKRYVIHQEMVMITNAGQGSNPRTLFNGVIVIPKGYRRFGPNDLLSMSIKCPALDIAFCYQVHYKEFR